MVNVWKVLALFHISILPDSIQNRTYHPNVRVLCPDANPIYGKIILCMKNPNHSSTGTPPRLFATLLKGFNTIANHWYLILFPIGMDLLLWLGPRLSVKTLFSDAATFLADTMAKSGAVGILGPIENPQALWMELLERINLASALRTIPIGVPSLIARESPLTSPLGGGSVIEISNYNLVLLTLAGMLLVGLLLGSLYFLLVSKVTAAETDKLSLKEVATGYGQSLALFCILILLLIFLSIPLSLLLALFTSLGLGLGQFLLMACGFFLLWLLMPLVFAPHGIFVLKQKALPSMLISIRLVRLFLPGTGLFIITCVLISEGLNMLWSLPEATSWMTLISIGGHAFVITGLLAASFIYYREGLRWMQQNLQKMAEMTKKQQENGGTPLEQQ